MNAVRIKALAIVRTHPALTTVKLYSCIIFTQHLGTCAQFYDGNNCQYYHPKRHCADLYVYNNITTTGAHNIYPPYSVNGHPPLSPLLVYCDMDTNGGGWTLLGNSLWNSTSGKTYAEYVKGFGDPAQVDTWLGLDVIHKMTNGTTETR